MVERATLFISPIVGLELEYLYEIGRIKIPSREVFLKIEHEFQVNVSDLLFHLVAQIAIDESWTRDPFDRMIVAQAKANGLAYLISSDEQIAKHYPRTIW